MRNLAFPGSMIVTEIMMLAMKNALSVFILMGGIVSPLLASASRPSKVYQSVYTHQKVIEKKGRFLSISGDPEYPVSQIMLVKSRDPQTRKMRLDIEFSGDSFRWQGILEKLDNDLGEAYFSFDADRGHGTALILIEGDGFNEAGLALLRQCLISLNAEEALRNQYDDFSQDWLRHFFGIR